MISDADLQIGKLAWGDSGLYYCVITTPDDLEGKNEDSVELLVLGKRRPSACASASTSEGSSVSRQPAAQRLGPSRPDQPVFEGAFRESCVSATSFLGGGGPLFSIAPVFLLLSKVFILSFFLSFPLHP